MTSTRPEPRTLLPVVETSRPGFRHGSRSYQTCLWRCGNACDHPEPNRSGNGHVQDEIAKVVARRAVLRGAAVGAGALVIGGSLAGAAGQAAASPLATRPGTVPRAAGRRGGPVARADFAPVPPNTADAVTVADGFDHHVIVRWGDPVVPGGRPLDPHRQTAENAQRVFGYNCDYVGVVPLTRSTALMVVNHEYTNPELMFPTDATYTAEQKIEIEMASHGMSVVRIKKGKVPGQWRMFRDLGSAPENRRIHTGTEFRLTGPAAGDDRLKTSADPTGKVVLGTLNNCAGGTTPWGTILSGEENFNQYFDKSGELDPAYAQQYARYGISGTGSRGWSAVDPRFDLTTEPHEPHRFGWVVEIDPYDPESTPRKHTMLGRFKHEGANVIINEDRRAVAYMGDDERGDYLYKFVSAGKYDPRDTKRARRKNMKLLTEGTLYVAKLTGDGSDDGQHDGTGEWIPLCSDTQSFVDGMSVQDVLIFTRLAGDKVGATRMDRPEDVEPNLVTGKVYAALTNNSQRGGTFPPDEANPVTASHTRPSLDAPLVQQSGNRNGYVLEMTADGGDHGATTFTWDLMLVCGDPEAPETYFAGFDKSQVSPISCPDNVSFDSAGNLWISTDGNVLGSNDGVFRVPTEGPNRGKVQQFLTVPLAAEACGLLIYDNDRSVFFAPQHPGEGAPSFEAPISTWPSGGFPRPSVCVAYPAG